MTTLNLAMLAERLRPRPPTDALQFKRSLLKQRQARFPRFFEAVLADARVTTAYRGGHFEFPTPLHGLVQAVKLMVVSDAFFALTMYRMKARLQVLGVPLIPRWAHKKAMSSAQLCIGDPVILAPGVYFAHGQAVLDGMVEVGAGTVIFPWVTVGLRKGDIQGPTIGAGVSIGTGAKVIGPVTIGPGATIGANAVVVDDVPARATAVGAPARVVTR